VTSAKGQLRRKKRQGEADTPNLSEVYNHTKWREGKGPEAPLVKGKEKAGQIKKQNSTHSVLERKKRGGSILGHTW